MLKLCQLNVNSLDNLKKINELNKWEKFKHTIDKEEVWKLMMIPIINKKMVLVLLLYE